MTKETYLPIKGIIGRITAGIVLVLISPLFLGLMLAVKLSSPGPIFFRQKRVGLYATYFEILKFRTMRIDTPKDVPTHQLQNPEQYITKVGAFLRRTSLDELPQLINILKGEMAFVGPRPALWNQYDLVEEREKYGANDILPGLKHVSLFGLIERGDTCRIKGGCDLSAVPRLQFTCLGKSRELLPWISQFLFRFSHVYLQRLLSRMIAAVLDSCFHFYIAAAYGYLCVRDRKIRI